MFPEEGYMRPRWGSHCAMEVPMDAMVYAIVLLAGGLISVGVISLKRKIEEACWQANSKVVYLQVRR